MNPDNASTSPDGLCYQITFLWERQSDTWPVFADGLASLREARTRSFHVGNSRVTAQWNRARVVSTSARVDPESLAARRCFLCLDHLPAEQNGIRYHDDWLILCNPAPLFEPHLTIASFDHHPQRVELVTDLLFDLARDLNGQYTVFYNGPGSGASAPDHAHLQAGPAGFMPFDTELANQLCAGDRMTTSRWLDWIRKEPVRLAVARPSHRPAIVMLGESKAALAETLTETIAVLGRVHPAEPEPMLCLFATFVEDRWIVWLFPRAAHRPTFYGHGPDDYLISPGAVDLNGIIICPRAEDFERLDADKIQAIYHQVLLSPGKLTEVRELLKNSTRSGGTGGAR